LLFQCINDSNMLVQHLVPRPALPSIDYQVDNGSVIEYPGDKVQHLRPSTDHLLVKRSTENVLEWPEFGVLIVDIEFYTNVGKAANGSTACPVIGQQRCIPGNRAFLTCTSQMKWAIVQACGDGFACKPNPLRSNRILCV
jgi:hypothetical protein